MLARGLRRFGSKSEATVSPFRRNLSSQTQVPSSIAEVQNPLSMMKESAESKNLCDEFGFCLPHKHWTFTIAVNKTGFAAPTLKTVSFLRVSSDGIDFVMRNTPGSIFFSEKVSFLYTQGKYSAGQTVTQWRADGTVHFIPLEWLLSHIPDYTVTEMVATMRAMKEVNEPAKINRLSIGGQHSHFMEIIQQVRADLAEGKITVDDLRNSIKAGRFVPENMERLQGGPDQVMWDRMMWNMENGKWKEPKQLLPF
jgi:hypothetical protein